MLSAVRRFAYEFTRCTRHNLLHLKIFRLSYRGELWRVRDGNVEMVFPTYPYLAFHDMEGYLRQGQWRPERGMTVLDVGGCFGEFALYASKRVGPTGRVLMLEPDPANIEVARQYFALNGNPANIEIVPAGLWNTAGTLTFNAGQSHQSAVAVPGEAPPPGTHVVQIATESLASLVERYHLQRLDFVKMDIEGAEIEAMSAAGELPPRFKPRYAIASYHPRDGKKTADVLPAMFSKLGYFSQTGYPHHLTTWASPVAF